MARMIQKLKGKVVYAYRLGDGSEMERQLVSAGKIIVEEGVYFLRSTEVVNTPGSKGQKAVPGDYFKVDGEGNPYPNASEWFLANHRPVDPDTNAWEQIPAPLEAWTVKDEMSDAMMFAIEHELIKLDPDDLDHYFGAQLWGSWLTAPCDATVVFYSVTRDENGNVIAIDFNFVVKEEVEKNYRVVNVG